MPSLIPTNRGPMLSEHHALAKGYAWGSGWPVQPTRLTAHIYEKAAPWRPLCHKAPTHDIQTALTQPGRLCRFCLSKAVKLGVVEI